MDNHKKRMQNNFNLALEKTLKWEGGYVNDPQDPGGETRYGISKRSYPHLDIKNITLQQARDIYWHDFWKKPLFNEVRNFGLVCKLFDLGVNMGAQRAVRMLQDAANLLGADLIVDGYIGPQTLAFVNGYHHPRALKMALIIMAGNHYIRQKKNRFIAGWLKRLNS